MKLSLYNEIIDTIQKYNGLSIHCAKLLVEKFPDVSSHTLYSILAIEGKNEAQSNYKKLMSTAARYSKMYKNDKIQNNPSGFLLDVAKQKKLPPALLLKHFLDKYYSEDINSSVSKNDLGKLMKNTTLIENKYLSFEAFLCILYDNMYGPIADSIGNAIGQEYEIKLHDYLIKNNIAFLDEEHLRSRGYDKTPDIKLEVPIAVDGVVINWIESKARFGSIEIHNEYMKKQFCSYWNRFGPGLIIYWFDYIDTLNQREEKRFIIRNDFPTNITHLNTELLKISLLD